MYNTNNGGSTWAKTASLRCYLGKLRKAGNGVITEFKPNKPVELVKKSDLDRAFENLDKNLVEVKTYITETYKSGTSWYRVYSPDQTGKKWCEQGGYLVPTGNSAVTISFLKDFIDTDYSFQRTNYSNHNGTALGAYYNGYWDKTTSSVTVLVHTTYINGGVNWEAKGYIS
jgi:hypothetical protein